MCKTTHICRIVTIYSVFSTSQEQYDSDEMAKEFLITFANQVFSVGQQLAFSFRDRKLLSLVVKDLEGNTIVEFRILYTHI